MLDQPTGIKEKVFKQQEKIQTEEQADFAIEDKSLNKLKQLKQLLVTPPSSLAVTENDYASPVFSKEFSSGQLVQFQNKISEEGTSSDHELELVEGNSSSHSEAIKLKQVFRKFKLKNKDKKIDENKKKQSLQQQRQKSISFPAMGEGLSRLKKIKNNCSTASGFSSHIDIKAFEEDIQIKEGLSVKKGSECMASQIKDIQIYVHKIRCLGMGKRLTWHLEHLMTKTIYPHAIFENPEHISHPVRIQIEEQEQLGRIIFEKSPFIYSTKSQPSFFFSENKVAIVIDLLPQLQDHEDIHCLYSSSSSDEDEQKEIFKRKGRNTMFRYFKKVRESLQIILSNLNIVIKNQVLEDIKTRCNQQRPGTLNQDKIDEIFFNTPIISSSKEQILDPEKQKLDAPPPRFWNHPKTHPLLINNYQTIEEQTESFLESQYESNYQQDSQNNQQTKINIKISQVSFGSNQLKQSVVEQQPVKMTEVIQELEEEKSPGKVFPDQQGWQTLLVKETYSPKIYLSILLRGLNDNGEFEYRSLFLNKLLLLPKDIQDNQLSKNIDRQLTLYEDELILNQSRNFRRPNNNQKQIPDLLTYGQSILNSMNQDIKPLLIIIGYDFNRDQIFNDRNSFLQNHQEINNLVNNLCIEDTKIIGIDLQKKSQGFANKSLNDYQFLCHLTQGKFLSLKELQSLDSSGDKQLTKKQRRYEVSVNLLDDDYRWNFDPLSITKVIENKIQEMKKRPINLTNFQEILFSRTLYQSIDIPQELKDFYDHIQDSSLLMTPFYQQNNQHGYSKITIQSDWLDQVNFSRICELRSRSLFKLNQIKTGIKTIQNQQVLAIIESAYRQGSKPIINNAVNQSFRGSSGNYFYEPRIKYLYWLNSEVVLACYIRKVINQNSEDQSQTEQTFEEEIESANVFVVYKLIGKTQIIENFIKHHQIYLQTNQFYDSKSIQQLNIMKSKIQSEGIYLQVQNLIQNMITADRKLQMFSRITKSIKAIYKFLILYQLARSGKFKQQKKQPTNQNLSGTGQGANQSFGKDSFVQSMLGSSVEGTREINFQSNQKVVKKTQKKFNEQKKSERRKSATTGDQPRQEKIKFENILDKQQHKRTVSPQVYLNQRFRPTLISYQQIEREHKFCEQDPTLQDEELNQKLASVKTSKKYQKSKQKVEIVPDNKQKTARLLSQEGVLDLIGTLTQDWKLLIILANQLEDWKRVFSYRSLDFIAPSNYSSLRQIYEFQNLINYQQKKPMVSQADETIIIKTFLELRKFLTFTLDGQTFLQVFKDKKNRLHNHIYGFCLVKLEWHAYNLLRLHQGFYQVSERCKLQFSRELKNCLESINLSVESQTKMQTDKNKSKQEKRQKEVKIKQKEDKQNSKLINFTCYQKNLVDLIIKNRNKTDFNVTKFIIEWVHDNKFDELAKQFNDKIQFQIETAPFYASKHFIIDQKTYIPLNKRDNTIQTQWKFVSDNFKTSKEVYVQRFQQRLDEGFVFISPFDIFNQNKSQFIKVFQARKSKFMNNINIINYNSQDDAQNFQTKPRQRVNSMKEFMNKNTASFNSQIQEALVRQKYSGASRNKRLNYDSQLKEKDLLQHIIVQYILKFEEITQPNFQKVFILNTILVMEKENAFFLFTNSKQSNDLQRLKSLNMAELSNLSTTTFPAKRKQKTIISLNETHFFHQMQEYISEVDGYQQNVVCTFHNIVKNCLLQSINREVKMLRMAEEKEIFLHTLPGIQSTVENQDFNEITHQLCYFKNINVANKRQLRRQNLERQIKERLMLMRKDQMCFLQKQYPELARDLNSLPLDFDSRQQIFQNEEKKTGQISAVSFGSKNKSLSRFSSYKEGESKMVSIDTIFINDVAKNTHSHISKQNCEDNSSEDISQKQSPTIDNNIFEIDGLLENATFIAFENFKIPNLHPIDRNTLQQNDQIMDETPGKVTIKDQNYMKKFKEFYLKLREIFVDFADFQKIDIIGIQNKSDLFFKQIAKEIILIVKFPLQKTIENQIYDFRLPDRILTTIRVDYLFIKPNQVNLTQKFKSKTFYKHFLCGNQYVFYDYLKKTKQQNEIQKISIEKIIKKDEIKIEQLDEQINQIDQIEDHFIIQSLEQQANGSTKSVQFETRVSQIVNNFLLFIRQNYERLFSETVLLNMNVSTENNDQKYLTKEDFEQTLRSMSESRFVIDISFLGLLLNCIREQRKDNEFKDPQEVHFKNEIQARTDNIFNMILSRNFKECDVDTRYLIFAHNISDDNIDLDDENNQLSKLIEGVSQQQKVSEDQQTKETISYLRNLQAGHDAFQENEIHQILSHDRRMQRLFIEIQEKDFEKTQYFQKPQKKTSPNQLSLQASRQAFNTSVSPQKKPPIFQKSQFQISPKITDIKKEKTEIQSNLQYHSCKKLILNCDLVVKDQKGGGRILHRQPIREVSKIFSSTFEFKTIVEQVVLQLKQKIRNVLLQRGVFTASDSPNEKKPNQQEQQPRIVDYEAAADSPQDDPNLLSFLQMAGQNDLENKLDKYRRIYQILDQFISDDFFNIQLQQPSTQIDRFDYHDQNDQHFPDENIETQDFIKQTDSSTAASIEIHFCFYSVPEHIGLIKNRFIDLLCFKKNNILVNDDDYEDLIRVANSFNILHLSPEEILRSQIKDESIINKQEKQEKEPLYLNFDNKQITQSIPFFYKHSNVCTDYRVFRYNEVQRKIIYGVLRRVYAMLAEIILQNLLRYSKFDWIGIAMMKKYLGHLLSGQRATFQFPILPHQTQIDPNSSQQILLSAQQRAKLIRDMLIEELREGYVLKFNEVSREDCFQQPGEQKGYCGFQKQEQGSVDGSLLRASDGVSENFGRRLSMNDSELDQVQGKVNESTGVWYLSECIDETEQKKCWRQDPFHTCVTKEQAHLNGQTKRLKAVDAILFIRVGMAESQLGMNVFIDGVFYTACFDKDSQEIQKQRENFIRKLKQIEDRIKIKLILAQIDETNEITQHLQILQAQAVIVRLKSKFAIFKEDVLNLILNDSSFDLISEFDIKDDIPGRTSTYKKKINEDNSNSNKASQASFMNDQNNWRVLQSNRAQISGSFGTSLGNSFSTLKRDNNQIRLTQENGREKNHFSQNFLTNNYNSNAGQVFKKEVVQQAINQNCDIPQVVDINEDHFVAPSNFKDEISPNRNFQKIVNAREISTGRDNTNIGFQNIYDNKIDFQKQTQSLDLSKNQIPQSRNTKSVFKQAMAKYQIKAKITKSSSQQKQQETSNKQLSRQLQTKRNKEDSVEGRFSDLVNKSTTSISQTKNEPAQDKNRQKKFPLIKFYEHNFELSQYMDLQSAIAVISSILVFSPFSIQDQPELFIISERALIHQNQLKLDKKYKIQQNDITRRFILRIPGLKKEDNVKGYFKKLEIANNLQNRQWHEYQLPKYSVLPQNKIPVELFGIDPISDVTIFQQYFQNIEESLYQQTLEKFSSRILQNQMVTYIQRTNLISSFSGEQNKFDNRRVQSVQVQGSSLKSKNFANKLSNENQKESEIPQIPFRITAEDMKFIKEAKQQFEIKIDIQQALQKINCISQINQHDQINILIKLFLINLEQIFIPAEIFEEMSPEIVRKDSIQKKVQYGKQSPKLNQEQSFSSDIFASIDTANFEQHKKQNTSKKHRESNSIEQIFKQSENNFVNSGQKFENNPLKNSVESDSSPDIFITEPRRHEDQQDQQNESYFFFYNKKLLELAKSNSQSSLLNQHPQFQKLIQSTLDQIYDAIGTSNILIKLFRGTDFTITAYYVGRLKENVVRAFLNQQFAASLTTLQSELLINNLKENYQIKDHQINLLEIENIISQNQATKQNEKSQKRIGTSPLFQQINWPNLQLNSIYALLFKTYVLVQGFISKTIIQNNLNNDLNLYCFVTFHDQINFGRITKRFLIKLPTTLKTRQSLQKITESLAKELNYKNECRGKNIQLSFKFILISTFVYLNQSNQKENIIDLSLINDEKQHDWKLQNFGEQTSFQVSSDEVQKQSSIFKSQNISSNNFYLSLSLQSQKGEHNSFSNGATCLPHEFTIYTYNMKPTLVQILSERVQQDLLISSYQEQGDSYTEYMMKRVQTHVHPFQYFQSPGVDQKQQQTSKPQQTQAANVRMSYHSTSQKQQAQIQIPNPKSSLQFSINYWTALFTQKKADESKKEKKLHNILLSQLFIKLTGGKEISEDNPGSLSQHLMTDYMEFDLLNLKDNKKKKNKSKISNFNNENASEELQSQSQNSDQHRDDQSNLLLSKLGQANINLRQLLQNDLQNFKFPTKINIPETLSFIRHGYIYKLKMSSETLNLQQKEQLAISLIKAGQFAKVWYVCQCREKRFLASLQQETQKMLFNTNQFLSRQQRDALIQILKLVSNEKMNILKLNKSSTYLLQVEAKLQNKGYCFSHDKCFGNFWTQTNNDSSQNNKKSQGQSEEFFMRQILHGAQLVHQQRHEFLQDFLNNEQGSTQTGEEFFRKNREVRFKRQSSYQDTEISTNKNAEELIQLVKKKLRNEIYHFIQIDVPKKQITINEDFHGSINTFRDKKQVIKGLVQNHERQLIASHSFEIFRKIYMEKLLKYKTTIKDATKKSQSTSSNRFLQQTKFNHQVSQERASSVTTNNLLATPQSSIRVQNQNNVTNLQYKQLSRQNSDKTERFGAKDKLFKFQSEESGSKKFQGKQLIVERTYFLKLIGLQELHICEVLTTVQNEKINFKDSASTISGGKDRFKQKVNIEVNNYLIPKVINKFFSPQIAMITHEYLDNCTFKKQKEQWNLLLTQVRSRILLPDLLIDRTIQSESSSLSALAYDYYIQKIIDSLIVNNIPDHEQFALQIINKIIKVNKTLGNFISLQEKTNFIFGPRISSIELENDVHYSFAKSNHHMENVLYKVIVNSHKEPIQPDKQNNFLQFVKKQLQDDQSQGYQTDYQFWNHRPGSIECITLLTVIQDLNQLKQDIQIISDNNKAKNKKSSIQQKVIYANFQNRQIANFKVFEEEDSSKFFQKENENTSSDYYILVTLIYKIKDESKKQVSQQKGSFKVLDQKQSEIENKIQRLQSLVINDIKQAKQRIGKAFSHGHYLFVVDNLWTNFFKEVKQKTESALPPPPSQPLPLHHSPLDSHQIHKLISLSLTQPIGLSPPSDDPKQKKAYKYGRVLQECRFDERAFAHLVARFQEKLFQGKRQGLLCFIIQKEEESVNGSAHELLLYLDEQEDMMIHLVYLVKEKRISLYRVYRTQTEDQRHIGMVNELINYIIFYQVQYQTTQF